MSVGTTWRASKSASDRGCVTNRASGRRTILGFVFEPCWRGRLQRRRFDASRNKPADAQPGSAADCGSVTTAAGENEIAVVAGVSDNIDGIDVGRGTLLLEAIRRSAFRRKLQLIAGSSASVAPAKVRKCSW
jgi:hypothetical protein